MTERNKGRFGTHGRIKPQLTKQKPAYSCPFSCDSHVPLIFMGRGVKPDTYFGRVAQNDVATTLASMLGIEFPSGSTGRILSEIFMPAR